MGLDGRHGRLRGVVFDFGGVFVQGTRRVAELLAELGLAPDAVTGIFMGPSALETVMGGRRFSIDDMVPHAAARLPDSFVGDRRATAARLLSGYVDPELMSWDESMVALARLLHDAGVGVGVLTNGPLDLEAARFRRFEGIADAIVLSGRDGVGKPSPEAFELIAARLGMGLSECFFVDDNASNTDVAHELGMTTHLYDGDISALEVALRTAGLSAA